MTHWVVNKPAGAEVKLFCCWQTWHPNTNAETSLDKPGHQTWQNREDKVLWIPKCPQVCNASFTTKASKVHHQVESLEALKRAEKGGDNTPSWAPWTSHTTKVGSRASAWATTCLNSRAEWEGRSGDKLNVNSDTHWRKKGSKTKEVH